MAVSLRCHLEGVIQGLPGPGPQRCYHIPYDVLCHAQCHLHITVSPIVV